MKTILRTSVLALATLAAAAASAQSVTGAGNGGRGDFGGNAGSAADRTIVRAPGANDYPEIRRVRLDGESWCQIRVGRGTDAHTFLRRCEDVL